MIRRSLIITTFLVLFLQWGQANGKPNKWDYLVTISTEYGEMKVILYDQTPNHKANFLKLINQGFYDSLLFHRVIKDFMIQGGDPASRKADSRSALGKSGPGYTIPAEILPRFYHKKGALAAARTGDRVNPHRASSGSQFYLIQGDTLKEEQLVPLNKIIVNDALRKIKPNTPLSDTLRAAYAKGVEAFEQKLVEKEQEFFEATSFRVVVPEERVAAYTSMGGSPHLDDQYTVFGQVIVGLEVIDKIAAVKTSPRDRPLEDVRMHISAERMKRKKITKLYGYQYDQ